MVHGSRIAPTISKWLDTGADFSYVCDVSSTEPVDLTTERRRRRLGKVEAARQIGISFNSLALAEAGAPVSRKVQDKIAAFYALDPLAIWPVEGEAA